MPRRKKYYGRRKTGYKTKLLALGNEFKKFDKNSVVNTPDDDSTFTLHLLNQIPSGTDQHERIANKVHIVKIRVKLFFYLDSISNLQKINVNAYDHAIFNTTPVITGMFNSDSYDKDAQEGMIRFIVFKWKSDTTPTIADLLEDVSTGHKKTLSMRKWDNISKFDVLIDKVFFMSPLDKSKSTYIYKKTLSWKYNPLEVTYPNAGSDVPNSNRIYYVAFSNLGATPAGVLKNDYWFRTTFVG